MTHYQLLRSYLEVVLGQVVDRGRHDERGDVPQAIVIIGASLLGATAVAVILWAKLKAGAEGTPVPAPVAP